MDSLSAQGSAAESGPDLFEIVRDVVADVAPEELPLMAALAQLRPSEIGQRLAHGASRDDPLGFGMGEVVAVVAPVVWVAVQQVVNRMAVNATDGLTGRARVLVRQWRHRSPATTSLPSFEPAELAEVRARVLELALEAGMDQVRAELLAYKVADRLGTSDSGKGTSS